MLIPFLNDWENAFEHRLVPYAEVESKLIWTRDFAVVPAYLGANTHRPNDQVEIVKVDRSAVARTGMPYNTLPQGFIV
jgi:hypothetical protein